MKAKSASSCLDDTKKLQSEEIRTINVQESIEEITKRTKKETFIEEGLKREDSPWNEKEGVVYWKTLLYIPLDQKLRERILNENHDHPLTGHPGIHHTHDLIKTKYYRPTLKKDVRAYVQGCDKCQQVNTTGKKTPLNPNTIPEAPWEVISVDIIGPVLELDGKDAILVIVDRFSKMIRLFPISVNITSLGVAKIFRDEIFKLHGIPQKVISDWGPQFVSAFMKELYSQLQIKGNPSTMYHPETDGQTERVNAWVEQYLQIYINHRQTDWVEWLAIVEFAHNQTSTSTTKYSPFLLNYRHQPRSGYAQRTKERNPTVGEFIKEMKTMRQIAESALKMANYDMKWFHDRKTCSPIEYKPGDLVLVESTNIWMEQPSKKLDDKRFGPFKVEKKEGLVSYHLKLDKKWRNIHPVFHECLLHPYHLGEYKSQWKPTPPPPEIMMGDEEHEIEQILDSRQSGNTIEYLVNWKGFLREENEWILTKDLANATEAIKIFHKQNPSAPHLAIKVWSQDISNVPCICPICLKTPTPTTTPMFLNPDFLEFQKMYNKYPDHMFEFPPLFP